MPRWVALAALTLLFVPCASRAVGSLHGYGTYEFGMRPERVRRVNEGLKNWRCVESNKNGWAIWKADAARMADIPATVSLRFVNEELWEVRLDLQPRLQSRRRSQADAWHTAVAAISKEHGAPDESTETTEYALASWRLADGRNAIEVERREGDGDGEGFVYVVFKDFPRFDAWDRAWRNRHFPR